MRIRSPLARLRPWLLPAACLLWSGYFAFHAVAGETGLMALGGYKTEHARLDAEAARVQAQRISLERHVALLDPRHPDPDLVDELVRERLNMVREDEVIVPLPKGD